MNSGLNADCKRIGHVRARRVIETFNNLWPGAGESKRLPPQEGTFDISSKIVDIHERVDVHGSAAGYLCVRAQAKTGGPSRPHETHSLSRLLLTSRPNYGPPIDPRPCAFELPCESQQFIFSRECSRELHPDRQTRFGMTC